MKNSRIAQVEVKEIDIARPFDPELFIRERPIETVARRLKELDISPEQVAKILQEPLQLIEASLAEEIYCPDDFLNKLLALTGMELVAIRDLRDWQEQGGHWYYGERCVYCNVNMYDAGLYGPYECLVGKENS